MDGRVHRLASIEGSRLPGITEYQELFQAAFPDDYPDDEGPITHWNAALAIAAYERTVLANKAPWQRWLRGEKNAMTGKEKKGAIVFFGKGGCVACHTGPALNSMTFHALGMNDLDGSYEPERVELGSFGDDIPDDVRRGRGGLVAKLMGNDAPNDEDYKFKTPQLYNLVDSPYYGHGASFQSIAEVVRYKNEALPQNNRVPFSSLSRHFLPLGLKRSEVRHLVAFIEGALRDPDLMRYVPARLPSGNCTPVNDPQAQIDLIAAGYCD
jgi:cytochrome c peroxidase